MKCIEAKNLSFGYKKKTPVFKNISFKIEAPETTGHIVAIMGPSGCGKTTLLKLLLGIEKSYTGSLIIKPQNAIFSYVPQEPILFEHLSPEGNARYFERIASYKNRFDEKFFMELVESLNLKEIIKTAKSVNEISGGQKQRISLLRALSIKPDFLFLDEPLTGLDNMVKENLLVKLLEIIDKFGMIVLYVSHHTSEVKLFSKEVIYMVNENGQFVLSVVHEPIEDFIENPPTVGASRTFNDTNYNIIYVRELMNKGITISTNNNIVNKDCSYVGFRNNSISFVAEKGIEFRIISQTPAYTILKLLGCDQFLKIETADYNSMNSKKLSFFQVDYRVHQYRQNGIRINNREK